MKNSRRFALVAFILIIAHVLVPVAAAHPLGNFTINHYAGLHVAREVVRIDYVLDMAEIPAYQEIMAFDANGDGRPDPGEAAGYHPGKCEAIRSGLELLVGAQPAALTLTASTIDFPAGAGGLPTLRLACAFRAAVAPIEDQVEIRFANRNYAERLGWREIVVTGEGVSLQGDVASSSISQRLTTYPNDLLTSPLDQREAAFTAIPRSTGQPTHQPTNPQLVPSPRRDDAFTQLITLPDLNVATLLLALGVSFAWGAMHALSPGHGKAMVAAYLVGARGTTKHAILLGLTVTLTHTIGVFALGLVTLFASNYVLPEQLYPYLSLASGLLVVGIGVTLIVARYRAVRSGRALIPHLHDQDHHHHDHDHAHEPHGHHDHAPRHHEPNGHTHSPVDADGRVTVRSLLALGISGGLIPCPTALVVLLSAIALGRVGFGMLLIVAFSAGLAAVLVGVGLLLVHGRRLFDRLPIENRALRLVPLAGAFLVLVAGVVMTAQAIASVGALSV